MHNEKINAQNNKEISKIEQDARTCKKTSTLLKTDRI